MGQVGLVGGRFVIAGGGIRRGEDEPPGAREAGGVEDPEGLADVDGEGSQRVRDRVGDPGPSREVDDGISPGDGTGDGVRIGQWGPDELVRNAVEVGEMADRQVIEDANAIAALDQQPGDRRSDEPGPACDEDEPAQRRWTPAGEPIPASGCGTQRTFWTNVAGSIRSRLAAIRSSIVSINSSFSSRG